MAVVTVLGEIDPETIGVTLPHEHFFYDLRWGCKKPSDPVERALLDSKVGLQNIGLLRRNPYIVRDNSVMDDIELVTQEVFAFKQAGGRTIVDVSSIGVGRAPAAVRNVAVLSGINVVLGCGYYTKNTLAKEIIEEPETNLMSDLVHEIQFGIGATGIRPGVIGEIGISPNMEEWDEKTLRISAQAHRETGLPIYIHIQAVPLIPGFTGNPNGIEVLRVLEKLKVNIEKVVVCHSDAQINLEYQREVLSTGAFLEFDHFGEEFYVETADFLMDRDFDRIKAMGALIEDGYAGQLLMSQDVCFKTDLVSFGGWGYAHILNNIVPVMYNWGWKSETIERIMIENPKKILNVK